MYNILELKDKSFEDLKVIAQEMGIKKIDASEKDDLVYKILDQQAIDIAGKKLRLKQKQMLRRKKSQQLRLQSLKPLSKKQRQKRLYR